MKNWLAYLLTTLAALVSLSAQATPVTFGFSFDNGTGNVSGTVTGRILGLNDNGTNQVATSVFIDTFPAGLGGSLGNPDVTTWGTQVLNDFTVANGILTSFSFAAQGDFGGVTTDTFILAGASLVTGICGGTQCNAPLLSLDNGQTIVAGGTLTVVATVPEPHTAALAGFALLGLVAARRYKRA